MVDLSSRLKDIKEMVDAGKYFCINRARQYGKTTMLTALADDLSEYYRIISLDFQGISYADFQSEQRFVSAFSRQVLSCTENIPDSVKEELMLYAEGKADEATLSVLFATLGKLCRESGKKIVLMIDEVDTASNNQVLIDFLAQLRFYYLKKRKMPTFKSVILAGVYDVRSIKRKIRPDEVYRENSPWNIGQGIAYVPDDVAVRDAQMFGFVKIQNSMVQIANRMFEMRLYHKFLLDYKEQNSDIYAEGSRQKNQFIIDGYLNVRLVLEKFVDTFDYLYGDKDDTFLEEEGRRYFMLFLRPIINGTGNCYVEPETRNHERMDLVIDYHGVQNVCELKIWYGNAYNERGEEQLVNYLDYFHLKKGYMLSFNFNKKKEIGVKEIVLGDKILIEAVV